MVCMDLAVNDTEFCRCFDVGSGNFGEKKNFQTLWGPNWAFPGWNKGRFHFLANIIILILNSTC